jgi:hypothetical protein
VAYNYSYKETRTVEVIMRIYNFPTKPFSGIEFQPIDLDYIVSIGPVYSSTFQNYNVYGKTFCSFMIYIKIGQAIEIQYMSGTYKGCDDFTIDQLKKEREKLIEAWSGGHGDPM